MPDEIKVKEGDFYKLINAVDSQRVDLLKMKAEIGRLTKMLERMQPASYHSEPSQTRTEQSSVISYPRIKGLTPETTVLTSHQYELEKTRQ